MKKIAIVQSNYIPWKGYFDLINLVDEFVLYDDCQYTRRDWRNRNRIKIPDGLQWLSIPVDVKGKYLQKICETEIIDNVWWKKHWQSIKHNYSKAAYYNEIGPMLSELYGSVREIKKLSRANYVFLKGICELVGINTNITFSMDYNVNDCLDPTENVACFCKKLNATHYISGPAAKEYIKEVRFEEIGCKVVWMDYSKYTEYPQLYGDFCHHVSIIDVLMNVGLQGVRKYLVSYNPLFVSELLEQGVCYEECT
ncbi:WbqC family protein [Thermodesulfobacteriota bacterium]